MKSQFTYNLFYNKDSTNFVDIMEEVLLRYIKKIINDKNYRSGLNDV